MKQNANMLAIRKTLARCTPLKAAYYGFCSGSMTALCHVSPLFLNRLRFRLAWGRWPDMEEPTTFDEKLQWLNFFWKHPLKARCGDKFTVRGFVEENGLSYLLPELFGVYHASDEIRLESLPDRFVLKCSHGCKCNVFCSEKLKLDWKLAKKDLDSWMERDYTMPSGELHYGRMKPCIICEEFLQDGTESLLPADYKLFCFRGRAYCTMVAKAREANGIAKLAFYDLGWKRKLPYCLPELEATDEIPEPAGYEEMVDCAQTLSRPFPFVRMDFYSIRGRARLGEMTFTPGACVSADYMTEFAQQELGRLIELPDPIT
jgi:hypothetical protein